MIFSSSQPIFSKARKRISLFALLALLAVSASAFSSEEPDSSKTESKGIVHIITDGMSGPDPIDSRSFRYDSTAIDVRLVSPEQIAAYTADPDFQYEEPCAPRNLWGFSIESGSGFWNELVTFCLQRAILPCGR